MQPKKLVIIDSCNINDEHFDDISIPLDDIEL